MLTMAIVSIVSIVVQPTILTIQTIGIDKTGGGCQTMPTMITMLTIAILSIVIIVVQRSILTMLTL